MPRQPRDQGGPKPVGAKRTARKAKRRIKIARETLVPENEMCRQGKHPVGSRIGRGCASCGKLDAW